MAASSSRSMSRSGSLTYRALLRILHACFARQQAKKLLPVPAQPSMTTLDAVSMNCGINANINCAIRTNA